MEPPKPKKTVIVIPGKPIDPETQKRLNEPLKNDSGFDPEDEKFLRLILRKVENGEIDLFKPSSLINENVYDKLPPEKKAVTDMQTFATLSAIREVVNLWRTYRTPTFQLQNLITKLRLIKERFEKEIGDVFEI